MKKWLFRLLVGLMALSAGLFGCTSGGMQTIEGKGETAAAYTMAAVLTQAAFQTLEARVTELSRATPTSPAPTDTPAVTPPAALTPAPPSNAAPGATCDLASYVTDVSVPDGTVFEPSQKFTKTWRLKNIGTCTWSTGYTLIHTGGVRMDGAQATPLSKPVAPGEMIDVSVDLVTPGYAGEFTGFWKLKNTSGKSFGVLPSGDMPLWVKINVQVSGSRARVVFDLVANYCAAAWQSSARALSCPSVANAASGSISRVETPVIEGGITSSLPALLTIPADGSGGSISGHYPAFQIQRGDRFKALAGCLDGYAKYDVNLELGYRTADGVYQKLGAWGHTLDGYSSEIDIDLSPQAGMAIELALTVHNNGSSQEDWAFWLSPAVWR